MTMTKPLSRLLAALLLGSALLSSPAVSLAAKGDCGQPSSSGTKPSSADALQILKKAVNQASTCNDKPCICDVNGSGSVTASDALLTLKKAVGQAVTLNCSKCSSGKKPCTSGTLTTRTGSDLDSGWTGVAHNSDLIQDASISIRTLRRCSTTTSTTCVKNTDCPTGETCKATCDCDTDTSCEVTGPTGGKVCLNSLKDCAPNRCILSGTSGAACATNADCTGGGTCTGSSSCDSGVACVATFGPPLPLSSGGTPVCVVTYFDGLLTGTADSATGQAKTSANLKSVVFLGISGDQPCPRCGAPGANPKAGQQFTCEGGQTPGAACTVDGVNPTFGGTSLDCAPASNANVSGTGLTIRFGEVSTGTVSKTAKVPCKAIGFTGNPLTTGAKCLGTQTACTSNADCKRCSGDSSISCASNTDCTGNGTCATAPDQPITCGYWCQCGFCGSGGVTDGTLPCFDDSECPQGKTCQQGSGGTDPANAPQQKPNDCSSDKFICGQFAKEECATTTVGKCTLKPYVPCTSDTVCASNNAGTCDIQPRPCFESRITRTGAPSPLGKYCAYENKACTTNTDCTGSGDFCADDASRAGIVALFCVPGTSNSAVNSAGGITGPGSIRMNSFFKVCRCGDGIKGCDETCDDGNTTNGDGCSDLCQVE